MAIVYFVEIYVFHQVLPENKIMQYTIVNIRYTNTYGLGETLVVLVTSQDITETNERRTETSLIKNEKKRKKI